MAEGNDFATGYALGQSDSGNRNGGGFFGGDGIWAILILAMLFGWGGGGFGYGGFGGGAGLQGIATRADINAGFQFNDLQNAVRGVQNGLSDGFYAVNTSLLNGFHGVDSALCTLGYQNQQGFNQLGSQLAQCCCDQRAAVSDLRYSIGSEFCGLGNAMQNGFRDVIDNQNANYRGLMDFLVQDKISTLTAENQSLKFAASQAQQNAFITANQEAQTAELIRRIAPMPVPAYSVPAPYPYGYAHGGCGCGC